jgi:hypothetical protein
MKARDLEMIVSLRQTQRVIEPERILNLENMFNIDHLGGRSAIT